MTESILTFLQSLEPKRRSLGSDSRDAYGFAVRPQHTHTYRQYIDIYKKEENERSKTWKIFLGQLAKHTDPCLSEGETKETSHVEATEAKEADGNGHGATLGSEATKLKEEVGSEEQYKEASLRTLASESKEEVALERSKGGDASSDDPDSVGSSESEKEKEVQLDEETKTCKVERRDKAREAICAIEKMMVSRVKKRKSMKNMNTNESEDHLSLIKEARSSYRESDDEFKEKVCVNEMPSQEESNAGNEGSSREPHFPWEEELESLVRGGVPKDLRGQVWQAFVGVKARRVERYYADLLAQENYDDDDDDQHSNSSGMFGRWRKQIDKDLPRIFPGHPALNDSGRDSLRRLLLAYARHNPSIGYCQVMNFFAGLLLLLMPEEDAFWTLVGIIDDYFDGYYTEEMIETQVDQLVFEELMRERFPKLAKHLDYLGVQLTWISAPWFLSIFINMLPWESVLRIWDVFLFEGNRVMLFRTALALMEFYGPALLTSKDAGDCITLLQSLAGSTFDSSQLVLTACMGFLAVTDAKLHELREKYRPDVLLVVEERTKEGRDWKDSKGLASKLYSFKHDDESLQDRIKPAEDLADGDASKIEPRSSNLDEWLSSISANSEVDSESDLQERVDRMKVVLFRLLEEKRAAVIRAEELEAALVELVKEDNRRELSAKIEELEQEIGDLHQALADKKEQEAAVHKVLMQLEQEQTITEEGRKHAEQDAAAERITVAALKEKYEKAMDAVAQMEKRAALAESMLEATMQSESDETKAPSSSQIQLDNARRKVGNLLAFGLRWRDKSKGKLEEYFESKSKSSSRNEESKSKSSSRDEESKSKSSSRDEESSTTDGPML